MDIDWLDIVFNILEIFASLVLPILYFVLGVIVLFIVIILANMLILYTKGYRIKMPEKKSVKKHRSMFQKLFIDFPLRFSKDLYASNPDKFAHHGLIVFTGSQGSGKTSAMTQQIMDWQDEFPNVKVATNYGYIHEDKSINHWRDITDFTNGIYGVIDAFDEWQNWFGSNASKDFPVEMLTNITQNRKNIRVMCGTAQNYYLLAKALRSQCTEVRECYTFLKCLCFVHKKRPIVDDKGVVVKWKSGGWYFFVHSDELRNSYDTYKVVDNLAKSGFYTKPSIEIDVSIQD